MNGTDRRLDQATFAAGCMVAAAAAIPFTTGLVDVLLLLGLLAGAFSPALRGAWRSLPAHPLVLPALLLFAWLAVGLTYTSVPLPDGLMALKKYRELPYIALLMPLFLQARWRRLGTWAFMAAMYLTLALSYLKAMGVCPDLGGQSVEYVIVKSRITHNTLMALAAYWTALRLFDDPGRRWLWGLALLLITYNVFFMIGGRTGQLVFIVLAAWLLFQRYRWRGAAVGLLGAALLLAVAYQFSGVFHERLQETGHALEGDTTHDFTTSTGQRLSFLNNSLVLAVQSPLLGHGIGSFRAAYARQVAGTGAPVTTNPHNEFLMLAVQGGLPAAALFAFLLWRQWRLTVRLPQEERQLAQALVLTMLVGCMLNSFLHDSTEGHVYAYFTALLYAPLLVPGGSDAEASPPPT